MRPISRRQLFAEAAGLAVGTLTLASPAARAEDALLDPASPEAQKLKYVEDARQASGATQGATCASCSLYQGKNGASAGPCQRFPGKQVKAAGWCNVWAPQM
jgi:hypothetical protein